MSSVNNAGVGGQEISQPSYFQSQRALLVGEIAQSLDSVLTNLNRLNRSLEAVIAVGNEFSSVEALWSTFEGVMGEQSQGVGADVPARDTNHVGDGQDQSEEP